LKAAGDKIAASELRSHSLNIPAAAATIRTLIDGDRLRHQNVVLIFSAFA